MRRYITYIAGIALAFMATSCMEFLKEEPKTFVSPENYYASVSDIEAATNGCYDALSVNFRGLVAPGCTYWVFMDNLVGYNFRTLPGSEEDMGLTLPVKNTNPFAEYLWEYQYISLENCNSVIEHVEACTAVTDEEKNPYLGEAYFLRAYYYFNLVRQFGPVPYKVSSTTGVANADLPLDSEETIYNGIVADLQKAETLLESQPWASSIGRVRKGAVKALLAKVYLTMAGYPLQKTENYALAAAKAKEVIDGGNYSLASDYATLRTQENTGEVIFSWQRANLDGYRSGVHQACLPFNELTEEQLDGVTFGGNILPAKEFYSSFDESDKRKTEWFYDNYGGVTFTNVHIKKFWDESALDAASQSGKDWNYIRYADVLLTYAEAKAAGSSTTDSDACAAINAVRQRAGLGALATVTADEVFIERMHEFCYECSNWYDMTRTRKAYRPTDGKVVDMFGYQAVKHNREFQEGDVYLPYPLRETRLNGNLKR